jgi:HNH endonuclease
MTLPRPGARLKAKDGAPLHFAMAAVMYDGPECLEWPYGKSEGYGMLWFNGQKIGAHVLVLGAWDAQPPNTEVCHNCDNRGCINPLHMRWGTRQDNVNDMMTRRGHWSQQ